jgi:hypothetical protein
MHNFDFAGALPLNRLMATVFAYSTDITQGFSQPERFPKEFHASRGEEIFEMSRR